MNMQDRAARLRAQKITEGQAVIVGIPTFAGKVRKIIEQYGKNGRIVTTAEIADVLELPPDNRSRIYSALKDLQKQAEVRRVGQGEYIWMGRQARPKAPDVREVMWRIFRARRQVTIDDLVELAGADREIVVEWMAMLESREVARRLPSGKWRLITDILMVPSPENDDREAMNSRLRARQQSALEAVRAAREALAAAEMTLMQFGEPGDES